MLFLVVLAFVTVTAGVFGVFMLISGRSQAKAEKAIENRLNEVSFTGSAGTEAAPGEGSMLATQKAGPLPNIDRVARRALKGSKFELWLEQTGTGFSVSSCLLLTVAVAMLTAIIAMLFSKRGFVGP